MEDANSLTTAPAPAGISAHTKTGDVLRCQYVMNFGTARTVEEINAIIDAQHQRSARQPGQQPQQSIEATTDKGNATATGSKLRFD
jgi:hypothetical protein